MIVFSCDRPAQLDLCLQSLQEQVDVPSRVTAIYKVKSSELLDGYSRVMGLHPQVDFVDETKAGGFKPALVSTLYPADIVGMLVDDIVFVRPISASDPELNSWDNPELLSVSLRLSPGITSCYMMQGMATKPPVSADNLVWDWKGCGGDWGYPMSLDGNLYRTSDLYPVLSSIEALNPNELEYRLAVNPINKPLMRCYDASRLVNIPHNRVQNVFANRSMNHDVRDINQRFLEGDRLNPAVFRGVVTSTVHAELPYGWLSEAGKC